jgi:hypothetical protein
MCLIKHLIFIVFHLTNTSNLLTKIEYPLSFVIQTDTLDLFVSIEYSLRFVIRMNLLNVSIN